MNKATGRDTLRGSIKKRSLFLIGLIIATMAVLVVSIFWHLHTFSTKTDEIMERYIQSTNFSKAFSNENLQLEGYIRPSLDNSLAYNDAIEGTDQALITLQALPIQSGEAMTLRQAIVNAMKYYRLSQVDLMVKKQTGQDMIATYLSLKTQSSYIDGYSSELLSLLMEEGNLEYEQLETENRQSIQWFAFLLGLSVLALWYLLTILIRTTLNPLTTLGDFADEIRRGHYDLPVWEPSGEDEVARTMQSFHLMAAQIRTTIQALEQTSEMEKTLRIRESEAAQLQQALQLGRFAQLQSQINPHFLFNTLSTIAALAREEGATLSEDLILRLSKFFRYSLESDQSVVWLSREIELLKDYMELQDTRYGGRITMTIEERTSWQDCCVPKFILQPLVENALLHGLKSRTQGGVVRIRIGQSKEAVRIYVTDNGCGFRQGATSQGKHTSIGISNIQERMNLCGGELKVFSIPGMGTSARITVGNLERLPLPTPSAVKRNEHKDENFNC